MRKISELTFDEYIYFNLQMPFDEAEAKVYCESQNVDFEEVKARDWGLKWQCPKA